VKRVGLIGGLGPESTVDYYKLIIHKYRECTNDDTYPEMIIDSLDVTRMIDWISSGQHAPATDYLVASTERLARAGAEFGAIAANTPHLFFDAMVKRSPIPFISIVGATCDEVKRRGFARIGQLGTRFTMTGRFYPEVFEREQLKLFVPTSDEIDYIHQKYLGELLKGIFLDETRERLVSIANRLIKDESLDAIALAGTELPLILRGVEFSVPLIDTAVVHVDAIVDRILS
jgi:aspartate racemase